MNETVETELDTSPLRFRHPLQPREAATGFAARLAAANGRGLSELLRHRGLSPWDVDRGNERAIRYVAAIGSANPDQLFHQAIRPTALDRRWEVAGEAFGPNGINRTYFRYCPHCVQDDIDTVYGPAIARPWLRIEWTLNHYRACHRHHVFLVNADPTRRRFQPFDFNETIASLFDELEAISTSSAPYRPSPFHDWIVARIEGHKDQSNWLDTLPLHVGAAWCENLGISSLHPPKIMPSKLTMLDRAIAADEGFRIASAGEPAIIELFERLNKAERRTRGIIGPRDTYGYAYRLLQETIDDPAFEPLRRLLRDFAMASMPWEPGTDILGEQVKERLLVTVRTAAVESGADAKTIRKIFKKKGLAAEDFADGLRNHRIVAPAKEIETVVRKLKGALTMPGAMKHLGIERRLVQALVDAGALPFATGLEREFKAQSRFAVEDIEVMMAGLMEGAIEIESPTDRQVPIVTARHMAGANTVQVLKLIFEKRLSWKGRLPGRTDFHGLLLDADEVTKIVRDDSDQLSNLRYCDVHTVIPNLDDRSVAPLVILEQLERIEEVSPNARRSIPVISRSSAERFRDRYVTAGELCGTHGLHHSQLRSLLERAGVPVAFPKEEVGALIYERQVVERAAGRKKDFWRYQK